MSRDRRDFLLRGAGVGALLAGAAACTRQDAPAPSAPAEREWKMVTSWPVDFPGLGAGAARLAESITRASGGRLRVRVYGGGELVPPFEVFDAVARGDAQIGHSASYYWRAKAEAAPFFCSVPFGLNAQEMNAWLAHGDGLVLWRELYARFGLVPFAAGNTGMQMAGWFKREIASLRDLQGLKMRIPGLGAEVIARVGAVPVNVPGAEIFDALKSGVIDASEWLGPFNDLAFGLFRVAKYCYFPGWQEPSTTLEAIVGQKAWDALPEDLQAIVTACCQAENDALLASYEAENARALKVLADEHGVEFRRLPDVVLRALREASDAVLEQMALRDSFARRVLDSMRAFRESARAWHAHSEVAYYQARG